MFHLKIDRLKYVQLYVLCMMMYKNSKKSEGKKKKKMKELFGWCKRQRV